MLIFAFSCGNELHYFRYFFVVGESNVMFNPALNQHVPVICVNLPVAHGRKVPFIPPKIRIK
jgi:hypothetical protein